MSQKKTDLAAAMADWCEMNPDERGFVLAHLQYLNLLAQRDTHRLLEELRAVVEEVGDEVIEAVELAGGEPDEEDLLEALDKEERGRKALDGEVRGREIEPVILDDEPVATAPLARARPTLVAVPDAEYEGDDQGGDQGDGHGDNAEPAPEPA